MKLANSAIAVLLGSLALADASLLGRAAMQGCGPQTKVCLAGFKNAAGDLQFECKAAVDGEKVTIKGSEGGNGAKVCGPGNFHFSPMQCGGDKFDYKKTTTSVDASQSTTGCQEVSFPYSMSCYSVSC